MLKGKLKIIWYDFINNICRLICWAFFRMHFFGRDNVPKKGSFLLLCNHQSVLDPVFCASASKRQLCFIARDSLFKNFFGKMIKSVGAIPIRRGEADLSAMKGVINKLREGRGVLLFPEATRTRDGKIADIKPGFGLLSRRGNAAVIPVVIDGAFECWPRDKKIFRAGRIDVVFGEPISPEEIKEMGDRKFAELLTKTLRQMQTECRTKAGKQAFNY